MILNAIVMILNMIVMILSIVVIVLSAEIGNVLNQDVSRFVVNVSLFVVVVIENTGNVFCF
ncbi:putative membrane protein (plasmid) [Bacillus cereus E33L]|nr:putative membrane protein [Bacillus cereus E33L]